ncbi:MAG: pyridoxamine 5'-phosphate oxidase family protein [Bacteroidota bacterium]
MMFTTKEEILAFINQNPLCFIATADSEQPRVRGIMTYKADEDGIIISTAKNKDFYKQLIANPKTELCFYHDKTQIRITGTATDMDENLALKQEIVAARPFIQPMIDNKGYDFMGLLCIINCVATVWDFNNPFARKRFIKLY